MLMSRYPPEVLQNRSIDVKARGVNMEWAVSSAVSVAPFWGQFSCSYCPKIIESQTLSDLIRHLMTDHWTLRDGYFTCCGCITSKVVTWDTYVAHFLRQHGPTLGLFTVLDETACHARMAWGVAMEAWITAVTISENPLNINLLDRPPSDEYFSSLGGFCTKIPQTNDRKLVKKVTRLQAQLMPEEMRAKEETRKKAAKKKRLSTLATAEEDSDDDPSDEEFQRIRNYYLEKKRKRAATRTAPAAPDNGQQRQTYAAVASIAGPRGARVRTPAVEQPGTSRGSAAAAGRVVEEYDPCNPMYFSPAAAAPPPPSTVEQMCFSPAGRSPTASVSSAITRLLAPESGEEDEMRHNVDLDGSSSSEDI
jgi:hypothetical protein